MGLDKLIPALFLAAAALHARAPVTLPVYIEDSHAGSFYYLAQTLDLTAGYDLILIDAHSDASQIPDSDIIRHKLLESAGANQLAAQLSDWRTRGVIQCFNWIEPLMPTPIRRVWWVPAAGLSSAQLARDRRGVSEQINAHQLSRPRSQGDFSALYRIIPWTDFTRRRFDTPTVVSIDLDYFAHEKTIAPVLDQILKLPQLNALTFAISRPYLSDDRQAHLLLAETIRYLSRVVNVDIHFEPFAGNGEDRSQKAQQYYAKHVPVPVWNPDTAPPLLRTVILQNDSRIHVTMQKPRWDALLERWRCDRDRPPGIKWRALLPAHWTYNLTNINQGFADNSSKYLTYREVPITDIDDLRAYFDPRTGLGTLRIFSERTDGHDTWVSEITRLERTQGEGFPGKLTEIFNLPYIYGSALLNLDHGGADCSSFIIYGARREGHQIPDVNPQGLLPYLTLLDEFRGFQNGIAQGRHGPISLSAEQLRKGVLLHFGKHIAAIYAGEGYLTPSTPIVHQLEGPPEITTFQVMANKYKTIRLMTFVTSAPVPHPPPSPAR